MRPMATPSTLAFAALIAEGHGLEIAERLATAAVAASQDGETSGGTVPLPVLERVADSGAEVAVRRRALTVMAAQLGPAESDRRAAAAALSERARLEAATGDAAAAAMAMESWRAALAIEPTFLSAARALRVAVARAGEVAAASAASETEASCLLIPAHRVRALMLAASLALEATPPERERALGLVARGAGGRSGARRGVRAAARAARRAGRRSGARGGARGADRGGGKSLRGHLAAAGARRAPRRASSAIRDGARRSSRRCCASSPSTRARWSACRSCCGRARPGARRARSTCAARWSSAIPATLRAIFLRLGEIYLHRVPDPKRATTAFERVLSVDGDNLEALRALSDLTVADGDWRARASGHRAAGGA